LKGFVAAFLSVYLDGLDGHGTSWPSDSYPQRTLFLSRFSHGQSNETPAMYADCLNGSHKPVQAVSGRHFLTVFEIFLMNLSKQ
jgi:hypothetical protein